MRDKVSAAAGGRTLLAMDAGLCRSRAPAVARSWLAAARKRDLARSASRAMSRASAHLLQCAAQRLALAGHAFLELAIGALERLSGLDGHRSTSMRPAR